MYRQNSKGGKAPAPKNYPASKGGKGNVLKPKMASPGGKGKTPKYKQANISPELLHSYKQALGKKSTPMKNGTVKAEQKGKASLNSVKNGKNMYLAGNETNRA